MLSFHINICPKRRITIGQPEYLPKFKRRLLLAEIISRCGCFFYTSPFNRPVHWSDDYVQWCSWAFPCYQIIYRVAKTSHTQQCFYMKSFLSLGKYLSVNCDTVVIHWPMRDTEVIVREPHLRLLNICSGNGLVPSGIKPLPEPVLTKTRVSRPKWVNHEILLPVPI